MYGILYVVHGAGGARGRVWETAQAEGWVSGTREKQYLRAQVTGASPLLQISSNGSSHGGLLPATPASHMLQQPEHTRIIRYEQKGGYARIPGRSDVPMREEAVAVEPRFRTSQCGNASVRGHAAPCRDDSALQVHLPF